MQIRRAQVGPKTAPRGDALQLLQCYVEETREQHCPMVFHLLQSHYSDDPNDVCIKIHGNKTQDFHVSSARQANDR